MRVKIRQGEVIEVLYLRMTIKLSAVISPKPTLISGKPGPE
jgi:hypothetical protein